MKGMHLTAIGQRIVLLEPGTGLDPSDPDAYLEPLMCYLQSKNTNKLIYDLKGVAIIDNVYQWLLKTNKLCQLCDIILTVVNMRPTVAFALSTTLKEAPPV